MRDLKTYLSVAPVLSALWFASLAGLLIEINRFFPDALTFSFFSFQLVTWKGIKKIRTTIKSLSLIKSPPLFFFSLFLFSLVFLIFRIREERERRKVDSTAVGFEFQFEYQNTRKIEEWKQTLKCGSSEEYSTRYLNEIVYCDLKQRFEIFGSYLKILIVAKFFIMCVPVSNFYFFLLSSFRIERNSVE